MSVQCYSKQSKAFLAWTGGAGAVSGLDAGKVTGFMVDWTAGRNTWTAKAMVTSLRAFLRFAHATGRTAVPLAGAVPAVASWRMSSLPRGMKAAEIGRLLAGCDRDTAMGLRDYAILSLLARLGLRGAEAAGLQLGDIDWRPARSRSPARAAGPSGSRSGPGRGGPCRLADRRPAVLRVAGGVRDDPAAPPAHDAAPGPGHHGQGLRAGGLERTGAHRLRHSLATEMLRAGASLPEVGQVLRHRSMLSTWIYAKVDQNALRPLARPWPGSAA